MNWVIGIYILLILEAFIFNATQSTKKNILKISLQKFGNNKKINTSLQRKQILKQQMTRIQLHIELVNGFSPKGDYTVCGLCYNAE